MKITYSFLLVDQYCLLVVTIVRVGEHYLLVVTIIKHHILFIGYLLYWLLLLVVTIMEHHTSDNWRHCIMQRIRLLLGPRGNNQIKWTMLKFEILVMTANFCNFLHVSYSFIYSWNFTKTFVLYIRYLWNHTCLISFTLQKYKFWMPRFSMCWRWQPTPAVVWRQN